MDGVTPIPGDHGDCLELETEMWGTAYTAPPAEWTERGAGESSWPWLWESAPPGKDRTTASQTPGRAIGSFCGHRSSNWPLAQLGDILSSSGVCNAPGPAAQLLFLLWSVQGALTQLQPLSWGPCPAGALSDAWQLLGVFWVIMDPTVAASLPGPQSDLVWTEYGSSCELLPKQW